MSKFFDLSKLTLNPDGTVVSENSEFDELDSEFFDAVSGGTDYGGDDASLNRDCYNILACGGDTNACTNTGLCNGSHNWSASCSNYGNCSGADNQNCTVKCVA